VEIVEGEVAVWGNVGHPTVTNGILHVRGGDAALPKILCDFLFRDERQRRRYALFDAKFDEALEVSIALTCRTDDPSVTAAFATSARTHTTTASQIRPAPRSEKCSKNC